MISLFRTKPTVASATASLSKALDDLKVVIASSEADRKAIADELAALKAADADIAIEASRASNIHKKLSDLIA